MTAVGSSATSDPASDKNDTVDGRSASSSARTPLSITGDNRRASDSIENWLIASGSRSPTERPPSTKPARAAPLDGSASTKVRHEAGSRSSDEEYHATNTPTFGPAFGHLNEARPLDRRVVIDEHQEHRQWELSLGARRFRIGPLGDQVLQRRDQDVGFRRRTRQVVTLEWRELRAHVREPLQPLPACAL